MLVAGPAAVAGAEAVAVAAAVVVAVVVGVAAAVVVAPRLRARLKFVELLVASCFFVDVIVNIC